jgi:DNA-binding transcriptional LysR family regulator
MNLSTIDLNLLHVLQVVLEERSATRAARRLHVTQSAVSNALARLRDLFRDPLLVREGRGLLPTPRALELQPELDALMTRLGALVTNAAAFVPESITRQFTLACTEHHAVSYVPRILPLFRQRLPRATLRLVTKDFELSSGGLATGEIDAAFTPRQAVAEGLHSEELFPDEQVVLVARRNHPKLRGRRLTLEHFNTLEHIEVQIRLGRPGIRRAAALDAFARLGLVRKVVLSVPHFTTAAWVAARSDLVAALPKMLAEELAPALSLAVLDLPLALPESFRICLTWHARTHADPASRYFRQVLLDALQPGPGARPTRAGP